MYERELTSKRLKQITDDGNQPSLLTFLLFESVEWIIMALLLWLAVSFTKPLWSPVIDFFIGLFNYFF